MRRLAQAILRTYPPSFRARYGDELAALVEDLPDSARVTANLARGAAGAWISPHFVGQEARRLRLQASISTTWVAWCAGFLIVPAMNKALLDPPSPNFSPLVRGLLDASSAILVIGWILALVGVGLIVARALIPALRARSRGILRPLLPAAILGILVTLGLVALVAVSHSAPRSAPVVWALVTWSCGLIAFLICLGVGPASSLRRLEIPASTLRVPACLAAVLALALAAICACSLIAALLAGNASLFNTPVPVVIGLAVACAAAAVALVSSGRGIRAARHP